MLDSKPNLFKLCLVEGEYLRLKGGIDLPVEVSVTPIIRKQLASASGTFLQVGTCTLNILQLRGAGVEFLTYWALMLP